jgi:hypothetical protein
MLSATTAWQSEPDGRVYLLLFVQAAPNSALSQWLTLDLDARGPGLTLWPNLDSPPSVERCSLIH